MIKIDGEELVHGGPRTRGSEAEFFVASPEGEKKVKRRRMLGGGIREESLLRNETSSPVEVPIELEFDADFTYLFEVRGYHKSERCREILREAGEDFLRFAYKNGGFRLGTNVRLSGEGAEPDPRNRRFLLNPVLPEDISAGELPLVPLSGSRRPHAAPGTPSGSRRRASLAPVLQKARRH